MGEQQRHLPTCPSWQRLTDASSKQFQAGEGVSCLLLHTGTTGAPKSCNMLTAQDLFLDAKHKGIHSLKNLTFYEIQMA